MGDNFFKCHTCNGDDGATNCPHTGTMFAGGNPSNDKKLSAIGDAAADESDKREISNYVPPNSRDEGVKRTGPNGAKRNDTFCIKITNLSESTTQTDLADLVKQFGPLQKCYVAKNKRTGRCKGLAYVHFKIRSDAVTAISTLHGYSYKDLTLNVNWSIPVPSSDQ